MLRIFGWGPLTVFLVTIYLVVSTAYCNKVLFPPTFQKLLNFVSFLGKMINLPSVSNLLF